MSTAIKYFTPAEAKKTLPLVKKIVADILSEGKEIKFLAEELNGLIDENFKVKSHLEKIEAYSRELEELGCYYKDWNFTVGLVDFPSVINNEEVFLCWRSDEEDILFYHSLHEGYAGRKLIPTILLDDENE